MGSHYFIEKTPIGKIGVDIFCMLGSWTVERKM